MPKVGRNPLPINVCASCRDTNDVQYVIVELTLDRARRFCSLACLLIHYQRVEAEADLYAETD